MSKLKITKIIKVADPVTRTAQSGPNAGKNYTIHDFEIDGVLDGEAKASIKVTTLNDDTANAVKEGAEFECEPAKFGGGYNLKNPPKPETAGGGKKPWGGGGNFAPATKYTREELKSLFKWAHDTAAEVMDLKQDPNTGWDSLQLQALQAGAATLVIAAQKCGLK